MKYTIGKNFAFAASHQLDGLPEGHQCGRLHGHNYQVTLELAGDQLGETGMVVDFGALAPFRSWIDSTLDHRHLNDVMWVNTTAENLAHFLYDAAAKILDQVLPGDLRPQIAVAAVTVWETPTCFATYRP